VAGARSGTPVSNFLRVEMETPACAARSPRETPARSRIGRSVTLAVGVGGLGLARSTPSPSRRSSRWWSHWSPVWSMMLTIGPPFGRRIGKTRSVSARRPGSFCLVQSHPRAVVALVQSGRAGTDKALQTLPSRDHRELGRPILDALPPLVQDPPDDVGDEVDRGPFLQLGEQGRSHPGRQLLVIAVRGVSRRRPRARLSRVVAAAAASQGSCRGRRTGQGQCRVIGQLVADWPVGVCVGWSPGSVHWYRRPGPARDLHPVSGGVVGGRACKGGGVGGLACFPG